MRKRKRLLCGVLLGLSTPFLASACCLLYLDSLDDFTASHSPLYSAAAVPLRVCFDAEPEGALWVFEAGMSVLFLLDVGFAFSTAYQREDGTMVYDRCSIARHYLLGWFWIDMPSAVPVELIEYTHVLGGTEFDNLATLRFLRMFRLFRLLRLLKIKEYITRIEEAFMINLRILKLVEIFVKLGFIAHILGWSVLQDLTHIYAYTSCAWPSRPPTESSCHARPTSQIRVRKSDFPNRAFRAIGRIYENKQGEQSRTDYPQR